MNTGEFGVNFVFSCGYDMSANTSLGITFTKPDGTTLTVSSPDVTVPAIDLQTTLGLFVAHQYVSYTFVDGDVDQAGEWSARVTYNDAAPRHLISDPGSFLVSP